ncbi:hypothetical protein AN639_09425 [Candidatus Epulonipiscium fishelsonii]|uniref:Uncharacterized protein n=1 Tax=Candidatus Epulonipiscium fishelsonii TaxID=77094 RepID=A0ACC8XDS0_9FIRM|nr:hypothetical protein AN639_09425 [Epulopiscium sp. SCG-B05WGA-EpuloA1]ONI41057.1 hypothetical protein AN396_04710 [Epulopiscium sp. SCG-B11WGA-EpuloA1]
MSFFKKLFGKKDKKEESIEQNVVSKEEKTKKQTLLTEEVKSSRETERERRERRMREFEENNPRERRLRELEEEERLRARALNNYEEPEPNKNQLVKVEESNNKETRIKQLEEAENLRKRVIKEIEKENPEEVLIEEYKKEELPEILSEELEEKPVEIAAKPTEPTTKQTKKGRPKKVTKEEPVKEELVETLEEQVEILIEEPVSEKPAEPATKTSKKSKSKKAKKETLVEQNKEEPIAILEELVPEEPVAILVEEVVSEKPAESTTKTSKKSKSKKAKKETLVEQNKEEPVAILEELVPEEPVEVLVEEVVIEKPTEPTTTKPKKPRSKKAKKEKPVELVEPAKEEIVKEEPVEILEELVQEEPVKILEEIVKEEPVEILEELVPEELVEILEETTETHQEPPSEEKTKEKKPRGKFNIFKAILDKHEEHKEHKEHSVEENPSEVITEISPVEVTTSEEELPLIPEVVEAEEIEVEEIPGEEEVPNEEPDEPGESTKPKKAGLFKRLFSGLTKTRDNIVSSIENVLKNFKKIDEDLYEELEETLIMADFGVDTTLDIMEKLRAVVKENKLTDVSELNYALQKIISDILLAHEITPVIVEDKPNVILVIGVNGAGKTTTIGKLSYQFKQDGKKVVVAAADTFRAAAIEQLSVWADRAGVEIVKHAEGSDPASVVYDGIAAAKARKADILICDTAGRLQNKTNLMKELEKIGKIIDREYPDAHKEVLIVLDATTGQNAISQVKTFNEIANVDGIVLTKLDGTAKGGAVVGICGSMNVPVKYIGVGEKIEDLQVFNPQAFAQALFATAEPVLEDDTEENEELESNDQ